jgi:uncharacterized membrane protein
MSDVLTQPFFVPTVIFMLLSLPLVIGLIPPNRLYGVRTRRTLSDEKVWYPANMFFGWCFFLSGAVYLVAAFFYPCTTAGGTNFSLWLLHLFVFVFPLLVSVLLVRSYIRHL